jgi:hypothetical protein
MLDRLRQHADEHGAHPRPAQVGRASSAIGPPRHPHQRKRERDDGKHRSVARILQDLAGHLASRHRKQQDGRHHRRNDEDAGSLLDAAHE